MILGMKIITTVCSALVLQCLLDVIGGAIGVAMGS
jgi:hypothetical protein